MTGGKKRRPTEFHYYDWHFNRWFGSETMARAFALGGLTGAAASGCYRQLLDHCYKSGDIPADLPGLAALCGLSVDEFSVVYPTFENKFYAHKSKPGRLTCDEVQLRRREWKNKTKQNASAGAKGGQKTRINKPNPDSELDSDRLASAERPLSEERRKKKEEINNKKEERENPNPFPPSPPKDERYKLDETFEPFAEAYRGIKPDLLAEDLIEAHYAWRYLDFEQKADRLTALFTRIDSGTWSDPAFIPKPKKFIASEWKRQILTPQKKQSKVEELFG
ncbi:MAG TPA: hypothetical protein VM120_25215 [Bryobacteraceae bacterium]|nr:hypothetical protein [Bryobacteraceae bacterium]